MELRLETKFIEGTNNQYSIRNDGVVIRHYRYYQKKLVFKDIIITGDFICHKAKDIKINREALIKKYFGKICKYCNQFLPTTSFLKHRLVCVNCKNKIASNKRESLTSNYVAKSLKIFPSLLTEDIYQAAKTRISIKRKIKQLQNGKKESHF